MQKEIPRTKEMSNAAVQPANVGLRVYLKAVDVAARSLQPTGANADWLCVEEKAREKLEQVRLGKNSAQY